MQIFSGGTFWGVLLVILGLSMVLKSIFKIDIPIFKTLLAIFLIYFGIKLLVGKSHHSFFRGSHIEHIGSKSDYDIIFGSSNIDLSNIDLVEGDSKINVDVVFGSAIINIDPDIPARIRINTVFAECKLPRGNVSAFGDYIYETPTFKNNENALILKVDIVFGSATIRE